jgi:hypothetical protein
MDPIKRKIEETLGSLENIRKAEPGPALFSRIQARLGEAPLELVPDNRMVYRFAAAIALLIGMNVMTIFFTSSRANTREAISQEYFSQDNIKLELQ